MAPTEDLKDVVKKEAAVLSESSITCLGNHLGEFALRVAMYLNVPTYTLVNLQYGKEQELGAALLLRWRTQRALAKDKDKVTELERALRDNGKQDLADILIDKHKENQEIIASDLPH